MSGDLRVITAHVRELAAKQDRAAADIKSATSAPVGVDTSVRHTHGVIAWSTAAAVEAIVHARRSAGAAMEGVSEGMATDLKDAAAAYDRYDDSAGTAIDDQMHPR
jgi:hypothetical protein